MVRYYPHKTVYIVFCTPHKKHVDFFVVAILGAHSLKVELSEMLKRTLSLFEIPRERMFSIKVNFNSN